MDADKRLVLKYFAVWRLLLFVPVYFASLLIPLRSGYEYTHISGDLLFPWANFDGVHYLYIAGHGYGNGGNFFPFYPIMIRALSFWSEPFSVWSFASALLVSNTAFYVALVFFYKLIKKEHSSKTALWSLIFILTFPTSFFFGSAYSESLFLALMLAAFWFAKNKNYWLATIAGFSLSITRLVGIMLAPVLACKHRKTRFLFIPLGTLAFALYNYLKWGDALNFIKAHGQLSNGRSVDGIVLIPQTLFRYLRMLVAVPVYQYEWWIVLLELIVFCLAAFLLYKAYKNGVNKTYIVFSLLTLLVPASSGTFSGMPRYIAVMFPIYVSMALIKSVRTRVSLAIVSSVLGFVLLMFFSRGYFVA